MPKRIKTNDKLIISLYNNGTSAEKIANRLNISKPTILKRLEENNTQKRKSCFKRQFIFNDCVFSNLTPESCYWAGFIAADGNIYNNILSIELAKCDENHLFKFCDFLEREHHLWYRRVSCSISIRSNKIIDGLSRFNITPRKSYSLKPPIIDDFVKHYIRGYFDGDGCVGRSGKYLKFTVVSGSNEILQWIKNILCDVLDIGNPSIIKRKNTKTFYLSFNGTKQVRKIMDWLYEGCGSNFLERKRQKYQFLTED